jgi:hypothetical protein
MSGDVIDAADDSLAKEAAPVDDAASAPCGNVEDFVPADG